MRWDLDRAVNFFMENGADGMAALPQPASHEVVDLSDDDSPAAPQQAPASTANDADDPELQEALAASRRAGMCSVAMRSPLYLTLDYGTHGALLRHCSRPTIHAVFRRRSRCVDVSAYFASQLSACERLVPDPVPRNV